MVDFPTTQNAEMARMTAETQEMDKQLKVAQVKIRIVRSRCLQHLVGTDGQLTDRSRGQVPTQDQPATYPLCDCFMSQNHGHITRCISCFSAPSTTTA
jgi:hypothetical protein